ncbi:acyl-CoA carboxylase epsilon subunit [Streptomyces sp. XD-27]|uniref:acyl-CoA carboxylase epsilon subunit n=1 Tax=Streptomyces sp. XD-27 TaxID=3062779 RepID=UPI0026F437E6|nr:acyl-CoA carboxylase epsilon subunit [Streptomyces sp. XD-27]WKX70789.1 acyl-CoA carboxylase epsilon subunit [Streptomyces sp. XD-27]
MSAEHPEPASAPGEGPIVEVTLPLHQGTLDVIQAWLERPKGTSLTVGELAYAIEQAVAEHARERRLSEIIAESRVVHGEPTAEEVAAFDAAFQRADEKWRASQEAGNKGNDEEWHAPLAS